MSPEYDAKTSEAVASLQAAAKAYADSGGSPQGFFAELVKLAAEDGAPVSVHFNEAHTKEAAVVELMAQLSGYGAAVEVVASQDDTLIGVVDQAWAAVKAQVEAQGAGQLVKSQISILRSQAFELLSGVSGMTEHQKLFRLQQAYNHVGAAIALQKAKFDES